MTRKSGPLPSGSSQGGEKLGGKSLHKPSASPRGCVRGQGGCRPHRHHHPLQVGKSHGGGEAVNAEQRWTRQQVEPMCEVQPAQSAHSAGWAAP